MKYSDETEKVIFDLDALRDYLKSINETERSAFLQGYVNIIMENVNSLSNEDLQALEETIKGIAELDKQAQNNFIERIESVKMKIANNTFSNNHFPKKLIIIDSRKSNYFNENLTEETAISEFDINKLNSLLSNMNPTDKTNFINDFLKTLYEQIQTLSDTDLINVSNAIQDIATLSTENKKEFRAKIHKKVMENMKNESLGNKMFSRTNPKSVKVERDNLIPQCITIFQRG